MKRLRVLILSRNYPNAVLPYLGLWVEQWARHTAGACEVRVVAPVPYCPPLPGLRDYTRFRQVPAQERDGEIAVYHPRFLLGPGYWLYNMEALGYFLGVRRPIDRLHRECPFDLIHAHFGYPDGVVAARLGRRYGVPVVVTEHALWRPWMDNCPRVCRRTVRAAGQFALHTAVSNAARDSIAHFTGDSERLRVIPVGVDGAVFTPLEAGEKRDINQILYVGRIHSTKGVDVLLRAMRLLADRLPNLRLVLAGGSFYPGWRRQEEEMHALTGRLDLRERVEFVGVKTPPEVAELMRRSALLVLPSQRESFGAVLAEALACGTPVVATRCGGPEEIVTDRVGLLVPAGDEVALAAAIERVWAKRAGYDPNRLREYALERFSWQRVVSETVGIYEEAVASPPCAARGEAEACFAR